MIPGVCQKHGITYRRFRYWVVDEATGKRKRMDRYIKLPDPTDPRFAEALERANATEKTDERTGPVPGSFGALARDFRIALAKGWTKKRRKNGSRPLSEKTLADYRRYIAMFEDGTLIYENEKTGLKTAVRDMDVSGMRPTHVYQLRDSMADTPGKANNWLKVIRLMLVFATERDWRGDNPADNVSPLPIGEHDPWPADVLAEALAAASPMLRLAIVSGLCSGQRVSDVILIQHNWLKTGIMELAQVKTGVDVAVPVHPWWREEIKRLEKRSITILYDRSGKPFGSEDRIQERIRVLMRQLGHVDENNQILYSFHGLRKNACCYLLETGLSDTDVGAILGMTPETVRHYGKRARAFTIATGAAEKMTSIPRAKMAR